MANFALLLLAASLAVFVSRSVLKHFLYHYRVRSNGCARPPKYAHKDPFFGLDLFAKYMNAFKDERFLDFNKQMFDRHGKTFESNVFGTRTFRTIDPEVSKACFATYAPRFGLQPLRYEVAKHLWGNGIIVVDGEHWKHGRALMRSSFEVVHLANFARLEKHVKVFVGLFPTDGTTLDLMPLFQRLILDTSSEFIFGEAIGALDDPVFSGRLTEAFAYAQKGTAIRAMLKRLKFLHRDEKWWEACQMITDYADKHVEKALQRLDRRSLVKEEGKGNQDDPQLRLVDEMVKDTQDTLTLRSHIISVFSPAHDGAAMTLTNAMFHLARQPAIWDRLREEIIPTKHESLTYDLLNSYRYVSHVLKETHRLTPIATLNQRQCLETTILPFGGGLDGKEPLYVEKGDNLEFNYRAMMRDESFWGGEADRFVPERWEHVRPGWEYTPFGGGPRSCPGQRLVFTESAYVLVTLLRKFSRVENRDAVTEWREEMRMTFQSKNGCQVGLIA
ncbi:cytochrome P450 [Paraphoma chrysanthemicola]|uniref:Cytochrome P450 n=1 Tax=Paraphoma chrysanthemicola TaxID=798071 RepID=A0A8K0RAW5_9PLEO|nr:cytochrome P450 [Paraphoma chrysanthemicola]